MCISRNSFILYFRGNQKEDKFPFDSLLTKVYIDLLHSLKCCRLFRTVCLNQEHISYCKLSFRGEGCSLNQHGQITRLPVFLAQSISWSFSCCVCRAPIRLLPQHLLHQITITTLRMSFNVFPHHKSRTVEHILFRVLECSIA